MLRNILFALVLLFSSPTLAGFSSDFQDQTVRLDYYHAGTTDSESVVLDELNFEGSWAGSRTHLTDQPDFGKYRFRILDEEGKRSLYEQGFSSLFGEWQTTSEAHSTTRIFHESVRFPLPNNSFVVQILSRDAKGALVQVQRFKFTVPLGPVRRVPAIADVEKIDLHVKAPPRNALDVVIIADGYPAAQREKARRDLHRFSKVFLATRPFDRHREHISIRGVVPIASDIGPNEPRKDRYSRSPVRTTFNTFGSTRYLTTIRNKELRDMAAQVPYDAIVVMVNTSRYGGAGVYNQFAIFVSDNEYDDYVLMHEFGHSFGGLGDEYYTSSVAYNDFYPRGIEPWEPNITALLNGPEQCKWKDLIPEGTPVPTPEDPQMYADVVGVYEGAGYSAKGLYRGAIDCKMFSKRHTDYCPVCLHAIEQLIQMFVE